MKRTVCIFLVVLVLTATFFMTGCAARACQACAGQKMRGCISCSLETYGECTDCTNILCSACMGEDCADTCQVAPCYTAASCFRTCNGQQMGCKHPLVLNGLSFIPDNEFSYEVGYEASLIPNLRNYYKVEFIITLTTEIDLSDVVISFDVSDVNGNRHFDIVQYVASRMKAGPENAQRIAVTMTFCRSDNDSVSIFNEAYDVTVSDVEVYAKR